MDADDKQVPLDSADEEIVARVAAIDVAKDSGMVCTRVPHPASPRRRTTTVWSVPARTSTIMNLAEQRGSNGSCSNRPRSTGGRSTTCSKHAG